MKKEVFDIIKNDIIKKELQYIGVLFLLVLIVFKIVFFKENLLILFRTILSLFWLFIVPGYFIMLYWREKLEFMERLVIGSALTAGINGIFSYYFGIAGLNIKYHTILLPLVLSLIGVIANLRKENFKKYT